MQKALIYLSQLVNMSMDLLHRDWDLPSQVALKVIGHRGCEGQLENTLEAFQGCVQKGVWGSELDIRWTEDNEPIVLHDKNAGRVFGRKDVVPSKMKRQEIERVLPDIPFLDEVVASCGKKLHLMVEVKELQNSRQVKVLEQVLKDLTPVTDYHFLSLRPDQHFLLLKERFPLESFIGISIFNAKAMGQLVQKRQWGGHAGQFLLLNPSLQVRHRRRGQKVGVGYVDSVGALQYCLKRNVDWVFSNFPLAIQSLLRAKSLD